MAPRQDYLNVLERLARIDPQVPEFHREENSGVARRAEEPYEHKIWHTIRTRARFSRFGQSASLSTDDIETARACLATADTVSIETLRVAILPLAALPVDSTTPDTQELYQLGRQSITAGDIRRARSLVSQAPEAA